MKKRRSKYKHKSIINKLLNNNIINESNLTFIDSLTLEDLIAVKIELTASNLNNKMYGLALWKKMPNITKEALIRVTYKITKSNIEGARFLGLNLENYLGYLKDYGIR